MLNEQTSIYLQIAQMMENDILRGIYQEEEQVPSTNELARQFRINPATAAKGVNLLVEEGILYKKRGIGMFVSTGAVAAMPLLDMALAVYAGMPTFAQQNIEAYQPLT